ncbi:hypothetical protein OKW76_14080 [Sphingomonas sp. S1-29]|uniref:Lipoprotein n=1 Tax=Sphingomonas qomolangmaensis TaxID=2918765 RepID=A0ABY5L9L5_9SPHN|nr:MULTISPECIES: hypothetical protein [Sphingomonas]UUL82661.1 hypothetical protein NMP03_16080 [Sphingomonas qomolangmaensis]UZK69137.1 hypothetical protein OKW76_14080 [Sphingomonas sp. S1-29]
MRKGLLLLVALPLLSGGCIAKTAWDVATLPVKAAGQAVDWTTTSQEESDRNYGRKMRKQEAEEGRRLREEEKRRKRAERDD